MSVRVLLFDLGGVVCHFLPERRLAELAALSGLAPVEIRALLWESGLDAEFDSGTFTRDGMVQAVCERLRITVPDAVLEHAWAAAFAPNTEVLQVVNRARARYQAALLTDNGPLLRDAMPRLFPMITRALDPMLFSCDLRARKPAPELFQRAIERLGVPPGDVLLIDDSAAAVAGARAAGMQAHRFTSAADLLAPAGPIRIPE